MAKLKEYHSKDKKTLSSEVVSECVDLIEEVTGLRLYDEQINAAKSLYKENVVNLVTGGGKTLVIILAAMLFLRDNRKVYVISTNDYLVKRDFKYARGIYKALNKKPCLILGPHGAAEDLYELSDIIYIYSQTLVFDYLRGIEPNYDVALVDEIDYVLVESASNTFAVATGGHNIIPPEEVYRAAYEFCTMLLPVKRTNASKMEVELFDMQYEADVILDIPYSYASLTQRGYEKLNTLIPGITENRLFMEAVRSCLQAIFFLERDIDYFIKDGEILLIDQNSGRVGIDCYYDICVQTALEIKEDLPIRGKFLLENSISYSVFFSLFKTVTGISGTASYVPYDFGNLLGKAVKTQSPHFKVNRKEYYEYFKCDADRIERIKDLLSEYTAPILIATGSDKRSRKVYKCILGFEGKEVYILDNTTLENEAKLLEKLKTKNTVLISNKIVGRGVDIVVSENAKTGLVVILAERLGSTRAEKQLIGRTARNGMPGTCYILTSREDRIFSFSASEDISLNEKHILSLQAKYEAAQYDMRKYLYLRDKVFLEIDRKILAKLQKISSYEEILLYFDGKSDKNIRKKLKLLIEVCWKLPKTFPDIIRMEYYSLRPYFQAQFKSYTDSMSMQFVSNDYFHILAETYIRMGDELFKDTLRSYIKNMI